MTPQRPWKKEFDELFHHDFFTEKNLTIEEMEQRKTYYTKELISVKRFISQVEDSAIERVLGEIERGMPEERRTDILTSKNKVSVASFINEEINTYRTAILDLLKSIRTKEL